MNIFVSYSCPYRSAEYLDSKRVIKMILESAQILSTSLVLNGYKDARLYRSTHVQHPVVKWAASGSENFLWLVDHYDGLLNEYYTRYQRAEHKCGLRLPPEFFSDLSDVLPNRKLDAFQNSARNASLQLDFTDIVPTTKAYRLYLRARWKTDKREPTW